MMLRNLVKKMNLEVFAGSEYLDCEIKGCYCSDLLSDVLGFAEEGYVWITMQTHVNVLGIASLKKLSAVVLTKGNKPSESLLKQAKLVRMPILGSADPTFETSGRIYSFLHDDNNA